MGLNYSFTFNAAAKVTAAALQRFLVSVETDAQKMGFNPTHVFQAKFETPAQREFARRIGVLHPITDEKLQGVVLVSQDQILHHDQISGRCRVLPQKAAVLVVTDERQCETVFAFARYPSTLNDINGRPLVKIPIGGRWHFSNFVQSPDPRYRSIVKRFAEAGYLEAAKDDFATNDISKG